jgi:hypothetical protein
MNKANANHIKTFEIKLALWLVPLLPPQGDVGSKIIVAEVVTFNGGKGGKGKRQKSNLNLIFLLFCCFLAYFAFKNSIITSKFEI